MDFFRRFIAFVRYVIAAYRQAFGGEKVQPSEADQTTAETADREEWEKAKAEYERQMQQSEGDFWKPEEK